MADPRYDIFFRGEILPGHDEGQVKSALAQLFKASDAKLAQLFSGKVNAIKKSVDKATAAKYQQLFKKAGAKAVIVIAKEEDRNPSSNEAQGVSSGDNNAAEVSAKVPSQTSPQQDESTAEEGSWDILPSGSDLLKPDERRVVPEVNIDLSGIKVASPFDDVFEEKKPVPPAPDTSHISVAPVGGDMNPDRLPPAPDLELDLSEFSVAEVGVTLVEKKEKEVPPVPDISHIKLV